MADIYELLEQINSAIYGEDVRESIHDAIEQCYDDATGNPNSLSAVLEKLFNGTVSGIGDISYSTYDHNTAVDINPSSTTEINTISLKPGTWLLLYNIVFTPDNSETSSTIRCVNTLSTVDVEIQESRIITTVPGSSSSSIAEAFAVKIDSDDELLDGGEKEFLLFMYHSGILEASARSLITAIKISGAEDDSGDTSLAEQVAQNTADIVALESKSFSIDANDYLTIG